MHGGKFKRTEEGKSLGNKRGNVILGLVIYKFDISGVAGLPTITSDIVAIVELIRSRAEERRMRGMRGNFLLGYTWQSTNSSSVA
jgi:hypothetical protein